MSIKDQLLTPKYWLHALLIIAVLAVVHSITPFINLSAGI